jgi:lipopolysaccharide/colanic/teichoic acid biosynthesis glycosyltransferase
VYSARELVAKRAFDVVGSAVAICLTAPLMGLAAALVKASSPGPILFRQQRVGRHGVPFEMWKFRSMRADAASVGPQVTADRDPRITPVGRVLRKTKLDELPELFNVLKGDLSLVGPRPEVARYVALYPPADRELLQSVRPGITDPATVRFRNEEEVLARCPDPERAYREEVLPEKLRMYREYLERASFVSDFNVLADTLRVVLQPSGAPR